MLDRVKDRGLVLLGCGKMGSAMLEGWLAQGVPPGSVHVIEPYPSDWLKSTGVHLNEPLPAAPAIVLLAVKPQMMGAALPQVVALGGGGTLFLSIAAGTTIASFEETFGAATPIIRAMPNTPAAVGRGISAITGNPRATEADLQLAEALLSAVGQVVRLEGEHQMDAVTAVSGSGPAYVFHLIEALAAAGEAEGLPAPLAMQLARATVCGAGELAQQSPETASQLRINVTSPGGTTAAALAVLMDAETGFPPLLRRAVKAAADRGRELGK
ncbi:pyrroline-5-carboxylate reductase [Gemmobacter caeni]|uniref:Pyrroline-5-carboxylate reductase n=1 Tax=Gemmobacter caeni TaxID=589035 RepID=A0A2T6B603_9RHOB|nr:pyrroline-5-carboxylate reductase [Gemmobacter caeni]PTX51511.1 pyrroline-5-carboxylate reductase [Gemmobacter caeni]TWJ03639.1 pyrroline-5-carboxylate reductase [Gemmobacter caeni]